MRVMLLSDKYKFDPKHKTRADIEAFEIAGPGYKAGGALLTGRKCVNTDGIGTLHAASPVWPKATLTARYAVIYKSRGMKKADKDLLVCCEEFVNEKGMSTNIASVNGPYAVEWHANGIVTFAY
jgi:hypothetical protein